ncbi:MAG: hypothetical protein KME13_12270 [Myxacorys californica WJT36-NPBG1]|jgi:hypothetical protein|nr:hypothetical protein [Myxacorys californica WJT36-NPBG1]
MKTSKRLLIGLLLLTSILVSRVHLSVAKEAPSPQPIRSQDVNSPHLLAQSNATPASPASPGRVRIQEVWRRIYQMLPDLPLENQYVNRANGKVDLNNTLVSRLIRYHYYGKGRPVNYRLDWKFTLADYLGVNEPMDVSTYPGADNLKQNPFERDRAAIAKLDRKQRNALIQALVTAFSPLENASSPPTPSPAPGLPRTPLRQPSGGAQLLK